MRASRSLRLAMAVGALLFAGSSAHATVIDQASVVQRGPVVELRFRLHGSGLGWELSTHGNQLWIELDDTRLALPPRPLYGRETPPVELVRAVDRGGARSRLVIQVAGKADYAVGRLPHTLLVRIAPAGEVPDLATPVLVRAEPREGGSTPSRPALATAPLAGAPLPAPARGAESIAAHPTADADASVRMPPLSVTAAPAAPPANAVSGAGMQMTALRPPAPTGRTDGATNRPLQGHPLVVIDPGHGGDDPGTEVGAPLIEKDLALQISLRLKNELEQRGVRAILTRTGDYFLTLHDRTAMADRERADLFISVHLNSSPDAATAGIETYYLNNTTDRATIRLAEMENAAGESNSHSASAQPDLNYILSDMRQQYKANESAALASMIESRAATDLAASFGLQVNGLGAKRGPFYVLVGAQMPAVLVECGFLSNRSEAQRLASSRYQEVLAMGIAEAVANYFNADAAVGNL
jgi:N-acetylmuramoyl-L-alanine amidase